MDDICEKCGRPITAKKRRCYYCTSKRKTGEIRPCKICGKEFYAAKWQLDDKVNNQGVYCSRKCKYKGLEIDGPGSRRKRKDGYIEIYYPKHPDTVRGGWMLEHRLIAEQKYGRRLGKKEHVHHINGIRDDNHPENLEVVSSSEHQGITVREYNARLKEALAELAEYKKRYGPLDKD